MIRAFFIRSSLFSVVIVLLLWEAGSRNKLVNSVILPPPSLVFQRLAEFAIDGSIWSPLATTLGIFAISYGLATLIGVSVGLAMGCNDAIYDLLEPLIELTRPIPKPALIPPLFLFIGIGPSAEVVIVTLASVFPIIINTVQGVRLVDPTLLETARTFHVGRVQQIFQIIFPAALPMILTGMRVSLGLALVMVVLAEMLAGSPGVGFLVIDSQRAFNVVSMYAWVFLLAALGVTMGAIFTYAEKRFVPWRGK